MILKILKKERYAVFRNDLLVGKENIPLIKYLKIDNLL